jgi:hypothetical protein
MGIIECRGHLTGDPERLVDRELALGLEPLPKRAPFHVRHHIKKEAARVSRVVHRQDVGMGEPGRHLDLAQESLGADLGGDLGPEDFDRDGAVVTKVAGEIDHRHTALAELAFDGITAGEAVMEALLEF